MGQIGGFGMQITTHSADETQALGQRLAKRLLPGDVIAYFGDLGAGKTALTRGIAQGLGVTDLVNTTVITNDAYDFAVQGFKPTTTGYMVDLSAAVNVFAACRSDVRSAGWDVAASMDLPKEGPGKIPVRTQSCDKSYCNLLKGI